MTVGQEHGEQNTAWGQPARVMGVLVIALVLVLGAAVIGHLWEQLILAAVIAFLLSFAVGFFRKRWHLGKGWAIVLTLVLAVLLIVVPLIFLLPALVSSIEGLKETLQEASAQFAETLLESFGPDFRVQVGGRTVDLSAALGPVYKYLRHGPPAADRFLSNLSERITRSLGALGNLISLVLSLVFLVMYVVYMLVDVDWIWRGVRALVPPAQHGEVNRLGRRLAEDWVTYVKAKLVVMVIVGALTTVVCWALGLKHALAIGFIGFLLEAIPHVGPILTGIVGMLVAVVGGSSWIHLPPLLLAALTYGSFLLIQLAEDVWFTPQVMGKRTELPPLAVLVIVLAGLETFGVMGGILAVPVVASLRDVVLYVSQKAQGRDPFPEGSEALEGEPASGAAGMETRPTS